MTFARARFAGVAPRAHKFGARRVELNGIRFDSQAEADRYAALLWLVKANQIYDLQLQPVFDLVVNGAKVGSYRGDFAYRVIATGERMVEDVKGVRTPLYKLKKKLVAALHGVAIAEVSVKDAKVKAIPVTHKPTTTRRRRR